MNPKLTDLVADLQQNYAIKRGLIQTRMAEFAALRANADDEVLFAELVYCIFTAGASAKMGGNALECVRSHLMLADHAKLESLLRGTYRFPHARSGYVIVTRDFLQRDCALRLRERLDSFGEDAEARRDFFARNKGVKGIGYKEASHYLRNIGYCGYAILDKHILNTLYECGVIENPDPPQTKKKYVAIEDRMREFAAAITINFDELDLLLWSNKTGEILK